MPKPEHRFEDLGNPGDVLFSRYPVQARLWGPCLCREAKSLVDCEGGEMDVVFGTVLHVPAIMRLDLFGRERIVPHFSLDLMVLLPLIGQCFEEGAAPRSRAPKNDCIVVECKISKDR